MRIVDVGEGKVPWRTRKIDGNQTLIIVVAAFQVPERREPGHFDGRIDACDVGEREAQGVQVVVMRHVVFMIVVVCVAH